MRVVILFAALIVRDGLTTISYDAQTISFIGTFLLVFAAMDIVDLFRPRN